MATLQRFKLLATQCAVAGSPTRSPSSSPVIHLRRRRKTLRMLLGRGGSGRRLPPRDDSLDRIEREGDSPEKRKELGVRHKLKDLFVSSPPIEERGLVKARDDREGGIDGGYGGGGGSGGLSSVGGWIGRRGSPRSLRPLSGTLRQRLLLRRAWRPVLVTIPE